jgi:predicted PolB exonuclease-like 3'-5' exonuclease
MAVLLGIPANLGGMDGSQVEALAQAGRLDEIAAYCPGDVIVTFRLMLRFAVRMRGDRRGAGCDLGGQPGRRE